MDGGRGKGMDVSVVGFGAVPCWRGFQKVGFSYTLAHRSPNIFLPIFGF
jgi:hypothetical protein